MTPINILYSPFDALGLDPQAAQFDPKELKTAFRLAVLTSHEDQRRRADVPISRWPTVDDVVTARRCLETAHQSAWEKFKHYPRTFWPNKISEKVYYEVPKRPFISCDKCKMPTHEKDENEHLVRSHDHQWCKHCRFLFPESDLENHVEAHHGLTRCDICQMQLPLEEAKAHTRDAHYCSACNTKNISSLWKHTTTEHGLTMPDHASFRQIQQFLTDTPWWKCRVCSKIIKDKGSTKQRHLLNSHSWQDCGYCFMDADDFDTHLERHVWVQCPYGSCGRRDAATFTKHVETVHLLQPCDMCGRHAGSVENLAEHIRNHHPTEKCRGCEIQIDRDSLAYHQQIKHGHIQCGRCELFLPPKEYDEHYEAHTRLEPCGECGQELEFSFVNKHLCKHHDYLRCPISRCENVVATQALLKEHFYESHTDFISCGECDDPQTPTGLKHHQRNAHGYRECLYCDEDLSPQDFNAHIEEQHPKVDCPECAEDCVESRLDDHLVEHHEYLRCPVCKFAQPSDQFLAHLQQQHSLFVGEGIKTTPVTVETAESHLSGQGVQKDGHSLLENKPFEQCSDCSKKFTIHTRFRQHMVLIHHAPLQVGEVTCGDCGKPFPNPKSLSTHRSARHPPPPRRGRMR